MEEKATDEFIGCQAHGFVTLIRFSPIIFPLEGNASCIIGNESTVGDSDPVCVA